MAVTLIASFTSCKKEPQLTEPETTTASETISETETFNSDVPVITPSIDTTDDTAVYVSEETS